MTAEEMNRIKGIDPADVWVPDFDYGEEISDEENGRRFEDSTNSDI